MINTRELVDRLGLIESIAVIPRVSSTNLVARRVVEECVANDLSLPQAIIIAGEQFAGRGRNQRTWSSPAGKGIYATTLLTRSARELPLIPLELANIIASFLRDRFGIDARVKWPNDVLAGGRKIAGILIEARIQDGRAHLMIGTGINIERVVDETRPNSIALVELSPRGFTGLDDATAAFIEHIDRRLSQPPEPAAVLDEWRSLSIHAKGDVITCIIADRQVSGTWLGIDEHGRALLQSEHETIAVSAGELIPQ